MGQYKKSTLTAAGERLVAQAIGGEIKLNITKVKTSNHQYPDGTNFKSLVDMDGIVQTMVGPKTAVYNDTLIQTRALFSNEEVKETYYIHNIGLYAMDGSEEVLFSISSATTPDEMPKYDGVAPTTCIYNIQNTISETSSVSLTINPAGYASIADIMELDEKKVDKTGDISETTINTLDEPATDVQFPVPVAGESTKTFLGKVKKFFEDTKNWMTGVCLIGQIVNNCVTNNDKLPLSAAQGKVLMDLYTVLNTKITQKSQSEFYTIADVTGVSTGQVTDGYHNVSKMSNGQFRYSAHFTCYPSAIPNGNIVGYLPESANPYQIVYEYTYDITNQKWVRIRIGNNDRSIQLMNLDGTNVTSQRVELEYHIDF